MIKDQITAIINSSINKVGIEQEVMDRYLVQERNTLVRLKRERTEYQNLISKMTVRLYQSVSPTVKRATEQEIERLDVVLTQTDNRIKEIERKIETIVTTVTTTTTKKYDKTEIFINDELSKRIIRTFVSKIEVTNQEIIIDWKQ
jgi:hypothetical protein